MSGDFESTLTLPLSLAKGEASLFVCDVALMVAELAFAGTGIAR
jgi:hypothetical protein